MKNILLSFLLLINLFLIPFLFSQRIIYAQDFYNITSSDDIYDLYYNGNITEEEKNNLLFLIENPIDLNYASISQLLLLPEMNLELAEKIEQRINYKRIENIYELISISGISIDLIIKWQPFIKISPAGKDYLYQKIKIQNSFNDSYETYISNEIIMQKQNYNFGLLNIYNAEKYYKFKNPIPKYFLLYENSTLIKRLIIGTYKARFGSGLTLSNSWKDENQFSPDISLENKFYGIAFTIEPIKKIQITYLFSISNPEIDNKFLENLNGINFTYNKNNNINFGFSWYKNELSSDIDSTKIIKNDLFSSYGIYFNFKSKPHSFMTELAQTTRGGNAVISKIESNYPKTSGTLIYRYYEKDFINPYSMSFSAPDDEPDNSDEKGIYVQIIHNPYKIIYFGGYYDLWEHPSSKIFGNKKNIQFKSYLTEYLSGEFYRTWKSENIDKPGDVNNNLQFNISVLKKFKIILNGLESKNNYTIDRGASIKLFYIQNNNSQWEYKIKNENIDINNTNQINQEQAIQYKLRFYDKKNIMINYTFKNYDKNSVKHNLKLELRLYW